MTWSEVAALRVPLKDGFKKGMRKFQLNTVPLGVPLLGKTPTADIDNLKLVCMPKG